MPRVTDDLESVTSVSPSALDPFGLLNEREREVMRTLINADTSLPRPGSTLPLSWTPTPPPPRPTAPTAPTVAPGAPRQDRVVDRRCGNCIYRTGYWVISRNEGDYIENYLPVGTLLCDECYARRRRFTNRYSFIGFSGGCVNHPYEQSVAMIRSNRRNTNPRHYVGPTMRGTILCDSCTVSALADMHSVVRFPTRARL